MRIAGSGKSADVSKSRSGQAHKEAFSTGAINGAEAASTVAPAAATDASAVAFDLWEAGDEGRSKRRAVVEQQHRTLDVLGALQQAYLEDHIDPRLARELVRRLQAVQRGGQENELAAVCGEIEQVVSVQLSKLGRLEPARRG